MCDWDRCGRVRASERMRSGGGHCGGRGRAGGGKHSGADAQVARCLAMLGPSAFSMKNRLQQNIWCPHIGPLHAAYIINFCG